MKVVNFRKFDGRTSARGFRCVGRFAVDIGEEMRIFDWQLIATPDGDFIAYSPSAAGRPAVSASPACRERIAKLAEIEMKSANDNDIAA